MFTAKELEDMPTLYRAHDGAMLKIDIVTGRDVLDGSVVGQTRIWLNADFSRTITVEKYVTDSITSYWTSKQYNQRGQLVEPLSDDQQAELEIPL